MNARGLRRHTIIILLSTLAALSLLLSACQAPTAQPMVPPTEPTRAVQQPQTAMQPTAVEAAAATQPVQATQAPAATEPAQPAQPPANPASPTSGDLTLNFSGLAQGLTNEMINALPADAGGVLEVVPAYRRVTLTGYPVTKNVREPQIFIYKISEMNEGGANVVADLKTVLQNKEAPVEKMPFLPRTNDLQVMHPQSLYLNFKNGEGVRFLTEYHNGLMMISNVDIFYTFQGLTSDGQYYIAATFPVNHPDLLAESTGFSPEAAGTDTLPAYYAKVNEMLDAQPAGNFTPDLTKLDALIQSIEIK